MQRGRTGTERKLPPEPHPRLTLPAGPGGLHRSSPPLFSSSPTSFDRARFAGLDRDSRAFFAHAHAAAGSFSAAEKSSTKVDACASINVDEASASADRFVPVAIGEALAEKPTTLFPEPGSVYAGMFAGDRARLSGRRSDP
jgi:hypothetical protein